MVDIEHLVKKTNTQYKTLASQVISDLMIEQINDGESPGENLSNSYSWLRVIVPAPEQIYPI